MTRFGGDEIPTDDTKVFPKRKTSNHALFAKYQGGPASQSSSVSQVDREECIITNLLNR